MKRLTFNMAITAILLIFAHPVHAMEIAGAWTKTTHPDPHNIILIFSESRNVKAIGYETVADRPANWHGEGTVENGALQLHYRYSADATPFGWEPRGRMDLQLSEDGQRLIGTARSRSGAWSDRIELVRVTLLLQP